MLLSASAPAPDTPACNAKHLARQLQQHAPNQTPLEAFMRQQLMYLQNAHTRTVVHAAVKSSRQGSYGCAPVWPVYLQQVNGVRLQPLQAAVHALHDLVAVDATHGRRVAHPGVSLRIARHLRKKKRRSPDQQMIRNNRRSRRSMKER